jgi:hypothetical protein
MSQAPSTHGIVIPFGKHKGELLTRVPVSYLRWMSNEPNMDAKWKELAKAEWERRGDTMPKVEISAHAIDRASLRVRKTWHRNRSHEDEGLYSWLSRVTLEAIEKGKKLDNGKIEYMGLKFVVAEGEEFPSLKTVMPGTRRCIDLMEKKPNSGMMHYCYLMGDDSGASHLYEIPILIPVGNTFACEWGTYQVEEHTDDYIVCERISNVEGVIA